MFICENCGAEYECQSDLDYIEDMTDRIAPGEFVPGGQCTECGAICHDQETILKNLKNRFGIKQIDWNQFNHDKSELEWVIKENENKDLNVEIPYSESTLESLRNIVETLEELQNQAVTYGYPEEEVFGNQEE